ncbi:hypothetical protein [Parapedobacter lycopersici]|uniref:hypothetical protein n=1 Tax=Parapedobacter lycopersici TaxID=1864939 RepID=UPI003341DD2B
MRSIWKWIIGAVAMLLVAAFAGSWYLSRHWKPLLYDKIREAVIRSTDSLYRITYDDLDFSLITGNASIKNLRLTPDSGVYARLQEQQLAPDNRYDIHVASLRIRRFHPRRMLASQQLHIDDIIIDTPAIRVINEYHAYNDTVATERDSRTLYQRISGMLRAVGVQSLQLNDINFRFTKKTDTTLSEMALQHVNLTARDILIDSLSQFDTARFYHTRAIDVDIPGFRWETADSLYFVRFDRLKVATGDKRVTLTGLQYAPAVDRAEFYRRKKAAAEMTTIAFPTIRLENIDLYRFVRNQKIYAGSLHIDSGVVDILKDLRHPRITTNKIGKSPHQLLLKMQQPLKIDSVLLRDVAIRYSEVSAKYGKTGEISFDRTSGVLYNVTNDTLALIQNKSLTARFTSYLMDTGKLDVVFDFDMLDKRGAYTYKGTLGPMDGRSLNRIITPLLNAQVTSANIRGVSFVMQADDYRSRGSLRFDYRNMRLNLLTPPGTEGKNSMRVASFLATSFVINDSNPDANEVYHTGTINYRRPETYSFFKTLWKSLLEGIKQCAGISKEREQRLMNTAEEVKEIKEKTGGFFRRIFKKRDSGTGNE